MSWYRHRGFHLNDHTKEFCLQTSKWEPPCIAKQYHSKVLLSSFQLNGLNHLVYRN